MIDLLVFRHHAGKVKCREKGQHLPLAAAAPVQRTNFNKADWQLPGSKPEVERERSGVGGKGGLNMSKK